MDWIYIFTAAFSIINFIALIIIIKYAAGIKNSKDKDNSELRMQRILAQTETNLRESIFRLNKELNMDISDFKDKINVGMGENFNRLASVTEHRLTAIENKVNERLDRGFKETNETFIRVSSSLARIDEAQKHIDSLSKEVVSLQEILGDKKARGNYGEIQLNTLLYAVFGEEGDVYKIQHQMGSVRVDVLLKLPEPLGNISVDSKFPLENYKKMIDKLLPQSETDEAAKAFRNDIRKHINDISSKYIIPNETNAHAVMFIPAEAIFSYIHAYMPEILGYAGEKNVWIVSPTTFMALLKTIQVVLKNIKRDEYAKEIHKELAYLGENFRLYGERWSKLSRSIETVYKDIKDVSITSDKIKKRFDAISSADIANFNKFSDYDIDILQE
jgi:DNA recombination protein RmuC